jgi:hypothetical protein
VKFKATKLFFPSSLFVVVGFETEKNQDPDPDPDLDGDTEYGDNL